MSIQTKNPWDVPTFFSQKHHGTNQAFRLGLDHLVLSCNFGGLTAGSRPSNRANLHDVMIFEDKVRENKQILKKYGIFSYTSIINIHQMQVKDLFFLSSFWLGRSLGIANVNKNINRIRPHKGVIFPRVFSPFPTIILKCMVYL